MSKGVYLGAGGVARKVKKMYVGVNNAARKVKKGYIGIGGAARLFFSGGNPELSARLTGGFLGEYGVAGIGDDYVAGVKMTTGTSAEFINRSFTKLNSSIYIGPKRLRQAVSFLDYALFSPNSDFVVVDKNLTSHVVNGSTDYFDRYGVPIGNFFAGDTGAMNQNLTIVNTYQSVWMRPGSSFIKTCYMKRSAQVGEWGFWAKSTDSPASAVNTSLTFVETVTPAYGWINIDYTAWGSVGGKYAIAAGGEDSQNDSSDPSINFSNAFTPSLTSVRAPDLSSRRSGLASFSLGDYAFFCGGDYQFQYDRNTVDVYDSSLVRTSPFQKSADTYHVAGAAFGNSGVGGFFGGKTPGRYGVEVDNIDVITI